MGAITQKATRYSKVIQTIYNQSGLAGHHYVVRASRGARHLSLSLRLDGASRMKRAMELGPEIALQAGCVNVIARVMRETPSLLTYQFQLDEALWEWYTGKDVTGLGVGLRDNRQQVEYSFDIPHSGVFGTTGSGKTETLRRMIISLAKAYKPEDLRMIVCDPNAKLPPGLENLSHLYGLSVATDMETIESYIATAAGILLERRRQHAHNVKPRVLLVIDELEMVLKNCGTAQANVIAIGTDGRNHDMNLLIATQRPVGDLFSPFMHLILNRYVGLLDSAKTTAYVTGRPAMQCHRLIGMGDQWHIAGPEEVRFQAAMVEEGEFKSLARGGFETLIQDPPATQVETAAMLSDPEKKVGRPEKDIELPILAAYLAHGVDGGISQPQAEKVWGLTRYMHDKYRDAGRQLLEELSKFGVQIVSPRLLALAVNKPNEIPTYLRPGYVEFLRQFRGEFA